MHQERDDELCLTIGWMAVRSTGVGVSKMALCLCHSSSRPHGGVTAAICWSHHWLWHPHYSPAVLTAHVSSSQRLYEQDGPYRQRDWFSHYGTVPLSPLCHPTSAKLTKKLSKLKACLKTHKGPRRHSAVVYHLCTFIWASDVPFFFRVAWQMPPLNLVLPREWMQLFNEHRSNYHNRETIKEN